MKNLSKKLIAFVSLVVVFTILFNLRIKNIKVEGNRRLDNANIVSTIFKNKIDKNSVVFFIKDKFFKHKVLNHVNDYSIEWKSPFSIIINVDEKPAIAFVRCDLKNVYFDRDGVINEVTDERKQGVIEVAGVAFKSYKEGERLAAKDMKVVNAILEISRTLYESDLPARYIEIAKNGDISVFVGKVSVVLGDTQNMEVKLQRLKDIYGEIEILSGTLYLSNARENMLDEQYIFKKSN